MGMQMGLVDGCSQGGVAASPLRLAMLGMIPGNGHPFSWSAIVNGYDPKALAPCPYAGILDYLSPREGLPIAGAAVTHVWTDNAFEAEAVARFANIPNIAVRPEDVLGEVDAVVIAVDDGDDHVERARPFVEAGLPVLVDKPLATNARDLKTFQKWKSEGAQILSSSGLRYAAELGQLEGFAWDWLTAVTCNTWKRYGIHVLEPAYVLTGPGYESVRSHEEGPNQYVHLRHASGRAVTLSVLRDAKGSFGAFHAYGAGGEKAFRFSDTYTAFRGQLEAFVDYATTGREPFPFSETVELMAIILAAIESSRQGGAEINLPKFCETLEL